MFVNHCHVMPEGSLDSSAPQASTVATLLDIMDELDIERAVVFAPLPNHVNDPHQANQWLWEQVQANECLEGFMTLNPTDSRSLAIAEEFAEKGLRGIKTHPPVYHARIDDEAAYPFYELAAGLQLPILFHTGVHGWLLDNYRPILIDRIAQQFPDLQIIVEHMGGWEFFGEALAVVRNNANCHAGITSTLDADWAWYIPDELLRHMISLIGSERVIFGADYPFRQQDGIRADIETVRGICDSPEETDNILGANIAALIGCD